MSILDYHLKTVVPPKPLKKECGELIKIIKDSGLPHSSICRKFPLNLVHGTRNYLVLGMDNHYIMEGSSQS